MYIELKLLQTTNKPTMHERNALKIANVWQIVNLLLIIKHLSLILFDNGLTVPYLRLHGYLNISNTIYL